MPNPLPSLQIEDLVVGTGPECPKGATVKIHYRGTLTTGEQFDSSHGGPPAEFPLRSLIAGWQQGIPGMKVGGTRKLTIPPHLGYGSQDIREGGRVIIPANSTLVFEIELLGVR